MFCPKCGSTQSDELKFCKSCGANLGNVREALTTGEAPPKFDWSKTWVAEMLQSSEEAVRKEKELERLKGITPEVKRRNEIKAGVITTLAGLGAMIFLYFFMAAVANNESGGEAEIVRRVWLAGIVPFLVGIGLLFNGIFLNKPSLRSQAQPPSPSQLPARPTNQLAESSGTDFSVVEHTTARLPEKREAIYAQNGEEKP